MPNIAVVDMAGKSVGEIALSDAVFGIEPNAVVMHMAVVNYLANKRQGSPTLIEPLSRGFGRLGRSHETKGNRSRKTGFNRAPQWRHAE